MELKVLIQNQNYDLIGVTEPWWDNWHDLNSNMKGRAGKERTEEVLPQFKSIYLLEARHVEKTKTENFINNNYRGKDLKYLHVGWPQN